MENLLGKCESNKYNIQSSTEDISGPKFNKYNAISNFASNNNEDNPNTLSFLNNIILKEESFNLIDKEDKSMINKKRRKQAKEESLTRKDNI